MVSHVGLSTSRSVVPIMCHSQKNYQQSYRLFSALTARCTGIQADVWLAADGKILLVGHHHARLGWDRTLETIHCLIFWNGGTQQRISKLTLCTTAQGTWFKYDQTLHSYLLMTRQVR